MQQRLEGAKERLASQTDLDNGEGEGRTVGGKHSSFIYVFMNVYIHVLNRNIRGMLVGFSTSHFKSWQFGNEDTKVLAGFMKARRSWSRESLI